MVVFTFAYCRNMDGIAPHGDTHVFDTAARRPVQILEDRIIERPIFDFLQHPGAPDLKQGLITGTRSEIESLKKSET